MKFLLKRLEMKESGQVLSSYMESQKFCTWEEDKFREFIVAILSCLEPKFYRTRDAIFDEGEEVNEAIFLINGTIEIGYSKI